MPVVRVFLVRHGETEANRQGIIQGQLNTTLNERGLKQSEALALGLQSIPFEMAYSSDLRRASETADIILAYHPSVMLHKEEELRERFKGARQGLSIAAAAEITTSVEEYDEFRQRIMAWWDSFVAHATSLEPKLEQPRHILVVSHASFLDKLITGLAGSGKMEHENIEFGHHRIGNCSVTLIEIGEMGASSGLGPSECGRIGE